MKVHELRKVLETLPDETKVLIPYAGNIWDMGRPTEVDKAEFKETHHDRSDDGPFLVLS